MGLDMYLTKDVYVKNWDHMKPENRWQVSITRGGLPVNVNTSLINYITLEVGYWRKANAIHKWFVDNVQGGVDECQRTYVDQEQLQELLNICNDILADNSKAPDLLPTTSGFFFGGTEYDEYYYNDIQATKEILERCLNTSDDENGEYHYQSSW